MATAAVQTFGKMLPVTTSQLPAVKSVATLRLKETLGSGAYGCVYRADIIGAKNGITEVAVKVNMIENHILGLRSLRELGVLSRCQNHPHIIRCIAVYFDCPFAEHVEAGQGRICDSIYTVMEYAKSGDLQKFLQKQYRTSFSSKISYYTPLENHLLQEITFQMLAAVEYTNKLGVIHRDLKTNNFVIVQEHPEPIIRLVDFGISRSVTSQGNMTQDVTTYLWRAPEICWHADHYGPEVDSWSMGCILFQMVTGDFFVNVPSDSDELILSHIYSFHPEPMPVNRLRELAPNYTHLANSRPRRSWEQLLVNCDSGYREMLIGLLHMDPQKRWSISKALQHTYWQNWRPRLDELHRNYPTDRNYFRYQISQQNYPYCHQLLKIFLEVVETIFHERWFNTSTIFLVVNMFYRITANLTGEGVNALIAKARLHVYIIIYMVVKYQICLSVPPAWHQVAPSIYHGEDVKAEVIRMEKIFIQAVNLQIDSPNPYDDSPKKLSKEECNKLLKFMVAKPELLNGRTPKEVLNLALS